VQRLGWLYSRRAELLMATFARQAHVREDTAARREKVACSEDIFLNHYLFYSANPSPSHSIINLGFSSFLLSV
jgi:hypothetical protein